MTIDIIALAKEAGIEITKYGSVFGTEDTLNNFAILHEAEIRKEYEAENQCLITKNTKLQIPVGEIAFFSDECITMNVAIDTNKHNESGGNAQLDHEKARVTAGFRKQNSNLARCYLALIEQNAKLMEALETERGVWKYDLEYTISSYSRIHVEQRIEAIDAALTPQPENREGKE